MKRWYQLSMLQILVTTAVVAIFVVKNVSPSQKSEADGKWSITSGWPIAHSIRSGSEGEVTRGAIKVKHSTEYSPVVKSWAPLMNIGVCAFACGAALSVVSLATRKRALLGG